MTHNRLSRGDWVIMAVGGSAAFAIGQGLNDLFDIQGKPGLILPFLLGIGFGRALGKWRNKQMSKINGQ